MSHITFEHREEPCEWIAAVFSDGTECSVSWQGDAIRVAAPPDSGLWWIKLDAAGEPIAQGTHQLCIPPAHVVKLIEPHGKAIAAALLPLKKDETDPVYIRFGSLPKGGRSRNWATGELEPGVSCYHARRRVDGGYMLAGAADPSTAIAAALGSYDTALLITGEYAGKGSDGEPCVKDPKILAELEYVTGKGFYIIDRHPGRGPAGRERSDG